MLKREPCRRLGEEWCRNQPNVATSQRHDVAGKSQQTLSLGEAIKGTGESHCGGSKFIFEEQRFEELELRTKERRLEDRLLGREI